MFVAQRFRLGGLTLLFAMSACGTDTSGLDGDMEPVPPSAEMPGDVDRSDEFFSEEMLQVAIEMETEDWESMRLQRKTKHSIFGMADCRMQEIVNPYTYFSGSVTINGEKVQNVGLRKKAHLGSQSTSKPGIKVRFNYFEEEQRFWGLKRFALNNSKSDGSYLRTCLSYKIAADAGLPAPRCTFARVSVNGEDLGVFVAQEEVKKPFLARHFSSDEGNLYEGTASDFRPEFLGGFEQETNVLTDTSRTDLNALYDVVQNASESELETQLGELVDLDNFYLHWAMESLIWHRDGYSGNANNYFLYADPGSDGKFHFLVWGVDNTMRQNNQTGKPDSVLASGVITNRLYATEAGRTRYYAVLDDLLSNVWNVSRLSTWIDDKEAVIAAELGASDARFINEMAGLRAFVAGRADAISLARAAGDPEWGAGMRSLPCRIPAGTVSGTFETTWDSLSQGAFAGGTATLLLEDGLSEGIVYTKLGARAGTLSSGRDRVQFFLETAERIRHVVNITFPEKAYFDGADTVGTHELISPPFSANVVEQDRSTSPTVVLRALEIGEGNCTFDEIDKTPGATVSGSFSANLYLPPN